MRITVAICTRNRAASLQRTLQSLADMHPIRETWEVLVVDNGSTDATLDVIASFGSRLPIRALVQSTPGLSHARNLSAASARGEWMVCTDDDTVVDPAWLAQYLDAFARWPEAVLFGGHIVPVLEEPVAPWFRAAIDQLGGPTASRDLGPEPVAFAADDIHTPYGANFAIRTDVQRAFPYDPLRGPGAPYFGDETTCFNAVLRAGHKGWWVPGSRVDHYISAKRQSERYIGWWYQMLGLTMAWNGEPLAGPSVFGAPRWLWKRALLRTAQYRLARLHAPPEIWVTKLIAMALDRGRLRYFRTGAPPVSTALR